MIVVLLDFNFYMRNTLRVGSFAFLKKNFNSSNNSVLPLQFLQHAFLYSRLGMFSQSLNHNSYRALRIDLYQLHRLYRRLFLLSELGIYAKLSLIGMQ